MQGQSADGRLLARLSRLHQGLLERTATESSLAPLTLLHLGTAVLLHGALEEVYLLSQHPLLDVELVEQLEREHALLAEDLELFESLWRADPESHDLATLSDSLLTRLRDHIQRDGRLLYDVPSRFSRARPS